MFVIALLPFMSSEDATIQFEPNLALRLRVGRVFNFHWRLRARTTISACMRYFVFALTGRCTQIGSHMPQY